MAYQSESIKSRVTLLGNFFITWNTLEWDRTTSGTKCWNVRDDISSETTDIVARSNVSRSKCPVGTSYFKRDYNI